MRAYEVRIRLSEWVILDDRGRDLYITTAIDIIGRNLTSVVRYTITKYPEDANNLLIRVAPVMPIVLHGI